MEIRRKLTITALLPVFMAMVMLVACNKDKLESKGTDLPVIDSYLMPGQPISVKLSMQKDLADTAVYGAPITGVTVYVSDGTKKVQLMESVKGTYTYADQTFLVAGKTYSLQFDYLTYHISAGTLMPAKPSGFLTQYNSVTVPSSQGPGTAGNVLDRLTWANPDSLNHVLVFKASTPNSPINPFGGGRPIAGQFNANKVSAYNVTASNFNYRGGYQIILLSVNQEYINLLNNNTRTSSQDLTQVPTNIVNGFGIFTAMQADTLSFQVY
jgi:hypothetical protein